MLRDLRRNGAQPKDTMYKAGAALVVGMGVVKDEAKKEVKVPSEEATANICVVTKERIPSGMNAAKLNMSDYDTDFNNVAKGEFVGLEVYTDGEKFATDQFKAGDFDDYEKGKTVAVGDDGKWMKTTKGTSRFLYAGEYMDNGHKMIAIEVVADPVAHA